MTTKYTSIFINTIFFDNEFLENTKSKSLGLFDYNYKEINNLFINNYEESIKYLLSNPLNFSNDKIIYNTQYNYLMKIIINICYYNVSYFDYFLKNPYKDFFCKNYFEKSKYVLYEQAVNNRNIKFLNYSASNNYLNFWEYLDNIKMGIEFDSNKYSIDKLFDLVGSIKSNENQTFILLLCNSKYYYNNLEKIYNILKYQYKYYDILLLLIDSLKGNKLLDKNERYELIILKLLYERLDNTFITYILNKKHITSRDFYINLLKYITFYNKSSFFSFNNINIDTNSYLNLYISILYSIIFKVEQIFNIEDIKDIISSINLNTLIGKTNCYSFIKYIFKYLENSIFNKCDDSGFSILLDSSKYSNLHLFKLILEKTEYKYWYLDGFPSYTKYHILIESLKNKDTRVFKYILQYIADNTQEIKTHLTFTFFQNMDTIISDEIIQIIHNKDIIDKKIIQHIKSYYNYCKNDNFLIKTAIKSNSKFFKKINDLYNFKMEDSDLNKFIHLSHFSILLDSDCLNIIFDKIKNKSSMLIFLKKNLYNRCFKDDNNRYIMENTMNINIMNLLENYISNRKYEFSAPLCLNCYNRSKCYGYNMKLFNTYLSKQYVYKQIDISYISNKELIKQIFLYGMYNYTNNYSYKISNYYKSWMKTIRFLKKYVIKRNYFYKKKHYKLVKIINNDIIYKPTDTIFEPCDLQPPVHNFIGSYYKSFINISNNSKNLEHISIKN